MERKISEEQGQALVKLARKTLADYLGTSPAGQDDTMEILKDNALNMKRGVFVTLHKKGQLRGCIGFLDAREPVVEAVRQNAINAAFRDSRFSPLKSSELGEIDIEVSVLTEPAVLEYTDSQDLMERLRPGIDGVIIRQGFATATFLPQVWEQLPDKEEFLCQLCLKAGLSAHAWRKAGVEVLTYQVQYFGEK